MKQIILDVSDDGEVRIETRGFAGKACLEEAQFIKDLLGKELTRNLTPAYYQDAKKKAKRYLNLCG
ncbi:DUF2997 domain-containing protein [Desulfatibacillum aliphaticivorans]|uniref:DUF2997 domain-containing protein n=1 Tax=Desulfatibacillum aliphaticivorans TaxID=218208 RepID=UPI00040069DF|nr:DUF2997 domain-containing protein [Desulfatibacillum aliphaticivorans]